VGRRLFLDCSQRIFLHGFGQPQLTVDSRPDLGSGCLKTAGARRDFYRINRAAQRRKVRRAFRADPQMIPAVAVLPVVVQRKEA
jgi:hypothetical protein